MRTATSTNRLLLVLLALVMLAFGFASQGQAGLGAHAPQSHSPGGEVSHYLPALCSVGTAGSLRDLRVASLGEAGIARLQTALLVMAALLGIVAAASGRAVAFSAPLRI